MGNKKTTKDKSTIPIERISQAILLIRGHKVIPDSDLAALYEVETKVLVQAVKRNRERFPDDFMFQLTNEEFSILRSQFVTSKPEPGSSFPGHGGRRYPPMCLPSKA